MAREKRHGTLMVVLTLVGMQALAVAVYLAVERARDDGGEGGPFQHEPVAGTLELPQLELVRHDGGVLRTRELLGEPVLLHFWATWCPPCREELPGLLQVRREGTGLRVVALSLDKKWSDVQGFFGVGEVPGAVFRDPAGTLARHYEVSTLPDTYLLDEDGVARARFRGARNWRSAEARERIASYLQRAQRIDMPPSR